MLRKLPFDTNVEVLKRFTLTEEGAAVVTPEGSPEAAIAALFQNGQMPDMVNFFAHGMPPREGVCWAIAVHHDLQKNITHHDLSTLAMAEKWVRDPQEGTRIKLMHEGEQRDSSDPLSWLCNAVAWNGSGSMGPVDGPVVLPPAGLHASALLGAIALLAGETEESYQAVLESAYRRGLEVAKGGWPLSVEEGKL
ncbi:hypothetical protein SAMN04488118_104231 [Epibacterium ulvae]|uniref:Uncharacterized protein n=2 Tax=Alphaproteobacteria TaxID=28211 RepID=A0A1G5QIC3_9RHOB|nr:hypothetical protein [Epibacterium ulvae]AFT64130.1 putative secreted protein [alpha proteobacterium U95]SCZ61356.1 hypothetical protein SAMN04488118_104231 [Epibacterium ulvae]